MCGMYLQDHATETSPHFMTHRWVLRPLSKPEIVDDIRRSLNNLPEALARALVLRGIDTFDRARQFFRPSLEALHDPFEMADMGKAVDRLARAIEARERILVYGDYDVDGTTATALLVSSLSSLGADVRYFIPDRFEHGYGLCQAGIDYAVENGAELIVAVDCGVTAIEEVAYAAGLGIDMIICDHHTPDNRLPDCVAVVNPRRADCTYPFVELCGCAVAYKLLRALLDRLGYAPDAADAYLDLVAVATAADVVPIHGENRILMSCGLKALRSGARLGLRKLASVAQIDLARCSAREVMFALGPRINAAGRVGGAERAVELLLSTDETRADQLAADLDRLNRERRTLDQSIQTQAVELADRQLTSRTRHAVILHHDDWHLGVLGIVASRLVDRYYRPAILLGTNDGFAKGSARSIAGINIYDALHECRDLLVQFGGHDYAAGLTVRLEDVPELQDRLDAAVGRQVTPQVLTPAIDVDADVDLADLDGRFWAVLKQFAPFGPANDPPVFRADAVELLRQPRTVGKDGKHLKFSVKQDESGSALHAIGFGLGGRMDLLERSWKQGERLDLLFCLEENTWNGRTSLQLNARDVRLSGTRDES